MHLRSSALGYLEISYVHVHNEPLFSNLLHVVRIIRLEKVGGARKVTF